MRCASRSKSRLVRTSWTTANRRTTSCWSKPGFSGPPVSGAPPVSCGHRTSVKPRRCACSRRTRKSRNIEVTTDAATFNPLYELADHALLDETVSLASRERQDRVLLIAALGEVDARRLYLGLGHSSLFTYCVRVL